MPHPEQVAMASVLSNILVALHSLHTQSLASCDRIHAFFFGRWSSTYV